MAVLVAGIVPLGAGATTTTLPVTTTTATSISCASSVVSTWTLTRMANETIAVPVDAMHVGSMASAARQGFGGLLLFGSQAPSSLGVVLARLQAMTPDHATMLVMTDEEGGGVRRLTNIVDTFPWAQTMGKNLTPARITAVAARVGASLVAHGVNTDLAPVADVDARAVQPDARDPDGLRSFGGSPPKVAADVVAFARGLTAAGVTATVKHFPGLGGASWNTDYGPANTKPWSVLQKTGLVPFEAAIAAGVPAVMVSNAVVPGLSSQPASLSPAVMGELRQRLGFQGLIMVDSLSARAISALGLGPPGAGVQAIAAGADLILFSAPGAPDVALSTARAISAALVRAVRNGTFPRSTLAAAAAQVLATRSVGLCPTAP